MSWRSDRTVHLEDFDKNLSKNIFSVVCVMVWLVVRFFKPEEPKKNDGDDEEEMQILLRDERRGKTQQPKMTRDRSPPTSPVESRVTRGGGPLSYHPVNSFNLNHLVSLFVLFYKLRVRVRP